LVRVDALAEEWLERTQPGYHELSGGERSAVAGFSIIWSVFEARALAANGNATSIVRFVDQNAGRILTAEPFDDALVYFQRRYVSAGNVNHRFGT
jgi:hypothetical protein